jgi:serine/threonine-protein kinase
MDSSKWTRIEELFERAQAQPPDARGEFLSRACANDPQIRVELDAMLGAHREESALILERFVVDDAGPGADDQLLGTRLGPWQLVSVLGRGGMATVYRAERADGAYSQSVAIKVVRGGTLDPHATRFQTERQVLARLMHPNIACLLDGGLTSSGTPYLVMELVDGVPITEWCDHQRLTLKARLRLFRVVCDAVHHSHRSLVVHRDLKPSNIFVARTGEVKLLDFGIAKLLDPDAWNARQPATRVDMRLLTPEYAAPEQRSDGPVTTATDVYSLGVVLYELLTGSRPETGRHGPAAWKHPAAALMDPIREPSEVIRRLAAAPGVEGRALPAIRPAAPAATAADRRRLARRVQGDLDRIVLRALDDDPERRYASAGQLGEEIGRFLDGRAVLAQPDTLAYRARKFVRRNRLSVTAALVFVAGIAASGIVAAVQASALAEQRRVAVVERDKAEQVVAVLVDLFEATNPAIRPDGDRIPLGEFLTGAKSTAIDQLRDTPIVRAKLQQVFGLIDYQRGRYGPARAAIEEALAEQQRLLGPDHPDAIDSIHALGQIHNQTGDESGARGLLEESLDRHRRVYGERHEKTARALTAVALITTGANPERALAMLSQGLDIQRQLLPANHPDIASTLGALAAYDVTRGELGRARDRYREAFVVIRDPAGRRHPNAITVMTGYASLLMEMNAPAEAESVLREAVAVAEEVLGPGTLTVADLLNDHAVGLTTLGRLGEAEQVFHRSFDQHVALLGNDHWRVRNVARNVGLVIALQRHYDDALPWLDRAISIARDGGHVEDPGLSGIQAQRARVLLRLGRRREALTAAAEAVSALEAMKDADAQPVLATARQTLGRILVELGRPRDAEPPLRAALTWFERFGADNPRKVETDCELGRALFLQGSRVEGRARLLGCLPVYREWGQADPEVVSAIERMLEETP